MKKPPIRKHMIAGKKALKEVMQGALADIADAMIKQIMGRARRATPSELLGCIKNVDQPGVNNYKLLLKTAMAIIASDAINQARKEIPKAKHVKLSDGKKYLFNEYDNYQLAEFDDLPPALQKRIQTDMQNLVGTQLADLEKAIYFQFTASYDSTDSMDTLQGDLEDAAEEYITGSSLEAGSGLVSAELINTARNAFFKTDEVTDQLDALQFVNGDPVTDICDDLAGTIFAADDPDADRYQPPLHWNCKSYIVPILKGNLGDRDIEDLKPSSSDLEDSIQFKEQKNHNH